MLNNEETIKEITSKCIDCLPLVYLVHPQENNGVKVIMAAINEEQEELLDNEEFIELKDQFGKSFNVNPKSCYAYGKLDLSPKSDDIDKISKANWFRNLYVNIFVFTKYDYNTHTVTSDVEGGRWYETNNIETYLPFLYGKIGKPERVVIFREEMDIFELKRQISIKRSRLYRSNRDNPKRYSQTYSKHKTEIKRKNKVSNLHFTIKK